MPTQTQDPSKLLEQQMDAYLQFQANMMRGLGTLFQNQARMMTAMVGKRSPEEFVAETQRTMQANTEVLQDMFAAAGGSLSGMVPPMPGAPGRR
ncbi:MAG TPA: hypothetical protein VEB20_14245 [Azospirillaceae bacterium]|nr:hypothetical protein [Azospirillaceae bacterium]